MIRELRNLTTENVVGSVEWDGTTLVLNEYAADVLKPLRNVPDAVLGPALMADGWSNGYLYLAPAEDAEPEGSIRIRWNSPGDFDRCTRALGKYVTDPQGLCAEYHHEATGQWPGKGRDHDTSGVDMASEGMPPAPAVYGQPSSTHHVAPPADLSVQPGEHWHAIMHVEGQSTGARMFQPGALGWREPPFAFHWQQASSAHSGTPQVVQVGLVTRVVRDGNTLHGFGVLDLASPEGTEYARRLVSGFARWVSIGCDEQTKPSDIQYVWAEGADQATTAPEETIIMNGRVAELSGVSSPAQDQAVIEPTPELLGQFDVTTVAAATPPPESAQPLTAAAHVVVIEHAPPRAWFDEPTDVTPQGAFYIEDNGRCYGYVAPRGVAHRSFPDRRVEVPMGTVDYSRWMKKDGAFTADGRVTSGPITFDCGHASVNTSDYAARREHYDNSCSVFASVRIGENKHGVWVAGSLMPGVTSDQITRASMCQLSGDWQPHPEQRGMKEFIAALLVPVPGFASSSGDNGGTLQASVVVDEDGALIASAVPVRIVEHRDPDWSGTVARIARTIGRDPETLVAAARARVSPI